MSLHGQSLISLSNFSNQTFLDLFKKAEQLRSQTLFPPISGTSALIFFENSTRTKLSFEAASIRSGLFPFGIDASSGSSLAKGESELDTVLNIAALKPDVLIIRSGDSLDMAALESQVACPIINAGWGIQGHPTQALLDLYTIWRERPLKGLKLLLLGDIYHSRVASSHLEIFEKFEISVAGCGPEEFKPKKNMKWFSTLESGLAWSNVAMALRVQLERHSTAKSFDPNQFHKNFGLTSASLKDFSKDGLILHPGPVNWGIEVAADVSQDPRTRILQQVENGLFLRAALIQSIIGRS